MVCVVQWELTGLGFGEAQHHQKLGGDDEERNAFLVHGTEMEGNGLGRVGD